MWNWVWKNLHLGHLADALPKTTYNKCICQKKLKQYITVGKVMIFVEPSAKVNPFPEYNQAKIRCCQVWNFRILGATCNAAGQLFWSELQYSRRGMTSTWTRSWAAFPWGRTGSCGCCRGQICRIGPARCYLRSSITACPVLCHGFLQLVIEIQRCPRQWPVSLYEGNLSLA